MSWRRRWRRGPVKPVQFGIPDVTLTVSVVAGKSKDAVGKIRWWVIEAGGSGKWSREVTQTLVLTLHPERVKPDGTRVRWMSVPKTPRRQHPSPAGTGKWPSGHPSW